MAYWALNSTLSDYAANARKRQPDFAVIEVSEAGRNDMMIDLDPVSGARARPTEAAGQLGLRLLRCRHSHVRDIGAVRRIPVRGRSLIVTADLRNLWAAV